MPYLMIKVLTIHWLTLVNDIVSFEQLGPVVSFTVYLTICFEWIFFLVLEVCLIHVVFQVGFTMLLFSFRSFMANSAHPDQTPRSAASDLGVHFSQSAHWRAVHNTKTADSVCLSYAPVVWNSGLYGAGDSGDIARHKCRGVTSDESWQCRRCAGVLIFRQNALHT